MRDGAETRVAWRGARAGLSRSGRTHGKSTPAGPMRQISGMKPHSEWRSLTAIAIPVVIVQVGLMLMGVIDTLMVGHLSASALASAALGNLYFFNVMVIAMGA